MSNCSKSTVVSHTKPVNVFYVWYSELCRRLNSTPAPIVKPARMKCETVLDFVGDRLKIDDWYPVIKALRQDTSLHVITIRSRLGKCQFLHDIDTEEKARKMKRRYGILWTAYIFRSLLNSLSFSIKNNQVLTCLELDGLPMFAQYLETLLQALRKNKTVKSLSLTHCPIKDIGCQMVCTYLRFTPNVEVVNLSACMLGPESGQHLGKLIKYQQINRYCESWHNSLRYKDPGINMMRGIKRITLNGNPDFSNEGLSYILDELEDDLWIKALDFQKCGITEDIVDKIVSIVEFNRSLEIIDFRQNDQMTLESLERIFKVLKEKQPFGYEPEYKWCATMLTLPCTSIANSISTYSIATNSVQKTKSAPIRQSNLSMKPSTLALTNNLRKTKTEQFPTKPNTYQRKYKVEDERTEVTKLNSKLSEEIAKRKQIEKQNEELKKALEQIQSVTGLQMQLTSKESVDQIISVLQNFKPRDDVVTQHDINQIKEDPPGIIQRKETEVNVESKSVEYSCGDSNRIRNGLKNGVKNGLKNGFTVKLKNGYKNGDKKSIHTGTSYISIKEQASQIFETLLSQNKAKELSPESEEDDDLLEFYLKGETKNGACGQKPKCNDTEASSMTDLSGSQASLYNFVQELKNHSKSITFKERPLKIKPSITETDKGT